MNWIFILGGGLLLYLAAKGGSLGATAQAAAQEVSTVAGGIVHVQVKLGNADPNYPAWLQQEIAKLFGTVNSTAAFRQIDLTNLTTAINTRTLTPYNPGTCGTTGANPTGAFGVTQQAGAAGSLAVSGAEIGAKIAGAVGTVTSAIPIVGQAISLITAGFSAIFAGHAQAVAREQSTLCAAVPYAQSVMARLDASYQIGTLSGPQIAQALESLYSQFAAGVEPIIQPVDENFSEAIAQHHCNAACVYLRELRGIIDAKILFDY